MAKKAPGKSYRVGISLFDLAEMIPDEAAATKWFEQCMWGEGRSCPYCLSSNTVEKKNRKPMPYRCKDCRKHFSVRTGTVLERSHIPLKKWAWGIYLWTTSLKGISAMKLHRDLKITYKSAWFMVHRLRECFCEADVVVFDGPVEVDETAVGGRRKNMHLSKRQHLTGRGTQGKATIVGMKERDTNQINAHVVEGVTRADLQAYVMQRISGDNEIFTDDAAAYKGLPNHKSVNHTVGEYVRGQAHTNGIESFWALLKRAHTGTYHKISFKHLQRYVNEFVGRHNLRRLHTKNQMAQIVAAMAGRRLMYRELTRDVEGPCGMIEA